MRIAELLKSRFVVAGFVLVDAALIVSIVFLGILKFQKKAVLDIKISPMIAKVVIDGKEYQDGLHELNPGSVVALVSADGFEPISVKLDLDVTHITKMYVYLVPNEDNLNYYFRNPNEYERLQFIGGEYAERVARIFSIVQELPMINFEYGGLNGVSTEIIVDKSVKTCSKYYCLMSTGDKSVGHIKTRDLIMAKGYDPDDYGVWYVTH